MKIIGLIVLCFLCTVLTLDWWVCYIQKECLPTQSSQVIEPIATAVASKPVIAEEDTSLAADPTPLIMGSDDKVQIIDDRIHFRTGARDPLSSQKVKDFLADIAQRWKNNPDRNIAVRGHTDNIGKRKANYLLGLKRGQSVRRILMSHGIPKKNIKVNSSGEKRPLGNNKSKSGRFLNRRVEVRLK